MQEERLLDAGVPPVVPLVARNGQNVQQLLDAVLQARLDWDRRYSIACVLKCKHKYNAHHLLSLYGSGPGSRCILQIFQTKGACV